MIQQQQRYCTALGQHFWHMLFHSHHPPLALLAKNIPGRCVHRPRRPKEEGERDFEFGCHPETWTFCGKKRKEFGLFNQVSHIPSVVAGWNWLF